MFRLLEAAFSDQADDWSDIATLQFKSLNVVPRLPGPFKSG